MGKRLVCFMFKVAMGLRDRLLLLYRGSGVVRSMGRVLGWLMDKLVGFLCRILLKDVD